MKFELKDMINWTIIFILIFLLLIFILIIIIFCCFILDILYILNQTGLITIIGIIIPTLTAILILKVHLSENENKRIQGQIKIIDSLLAELEVISSLRNDYYCYGNPPKGNLDWYLEKIREERGYTNKEEKRPINELDHEINKISFQNYITKLDASIFKKLNIKRLVRTISYVNDKILQINSKINCKETWIKDMKEKERHLEWLETVICEAMRCIKNMRRVLRSEKEVLSKSI